MYISYVGEAPECFRDQSTRNLSKWNLAWPLLLLIRILTAKGVLAEAGGGTILL